jgi:predicted MFS family arabinose efflux permease
VPISRGPETGWPWWIVTPLACSPALIAGFLWYERRLERLRRAPIVPPGLFSERRFATGIVAILLLYAAGANAPLVFVLTHHLQDGLGASPLQTGLVFAPLGLGFAVASATAPRSYRRFGRAVPITGSCIVAAALGGIAAVAAVAPVAVQPVLVAALMLVAGTGQGLATNPLVALVLAAAPDDAVGVASGVLLTTTQVGNGLGVTGIGAVFFAVLRPDAPAATAHAQALAWSSALLAVVTVAALVVVATPERRSSPSYLPNSCTQ